MIAYICPKCGNGILRFSVKKGFGISFDLEKSNQFAYCANCNRRISYSVQKSSKSDNPLLEVGKH